MEKMFKMREYVFTVINWESGKLKDFSLNLEVGPNAPNIGTQACQLLEDFQKFAAYPGNVESYQLKVNLEDGTNYEIDMPIWKFMEEMADYMRMEIVALTDNY